MAAQQEDLDAYGDEDYYDEEDYYEEDGLFDESEQEMDYGQHVM